MVVVNRGHTPTFARNEQKSFIDVSLCTDRLYDNIQHEEYFNLHTNIYFQIQNEGENKTNTQVQISKLNGIPSVKKYTKAIQETCSKVLTSKGIKAVWKPVYWWTQEIECIRARRKSNDSEISRRE